MIDPTPLDRMAWEADAWRALAEANGALAIRKSKRAYALRDLAHQRLNELGITAGAPSAASRVGACPCESPHEDPGPHLERCATKALMDVEEPGGVF